MLQRFKSHIPAALVCAALTFLTVSTGQCEEPRIRDDELATVPLVAFRQFDPDAVYIRRRDAKNKAVAGIPTELFLKAVKSSEEVRKQLAKIGVDPDKATVDEWYQAAEALATSKDWQEKKRTPQGVAHSEPIEFKVPSSTKVSFFDPDLLIDFAGSGLFDPEVTEKDVVVNGKSFSVLLLNAEHARVLKDAYTALDEDGDGELNARENGAQYCSGVLNIFPGMSRHVKQVVGKVTFGKPAIYSVEKKKIPVQRAIGETGEWYWMDLAMTVRDTKLSELKSIKLVVNLAPRTVTSLALIPECTNKPIIQASPGTQLDVSAAPHLMAFKNVPPLVRPGGLRDSKLFWELSGDAAMQVTHKFAVVFQAPSMLESINLELAVEATLKSHLFLKEAVLTDKVETTVPLVEKPSPK